MILPLQNNIHNGVRPASSSEGLSQPKNESQFAGVLETIASTNKVVKAVPQDHLDKTRSLGNRDKTIFHPQTLAPELVDEELSVLQNNVSANVDAHLREKNTDYEEEKDEESGNILTTSNTLNPTDSSLIYSDKNIITYKTDTFEGTVTLSASASSKIPQKDILTETLSITADEEGGRLDAEPQGITETLVLNPTYAIKGGAFTQLEDKSMTLDWDTQGVQDVPTTLEKMSAEDQESTFTGSDTSDHEGSLEPLDDRFIDLNPMPKPNGMGNESAASLEKTIRISETGAIHHMYEAIADAHKTLKPSESKTLTIQLTPEELGAVHIELHADDMGNIRATLFLEKQETFKLFQQDVEQLKTVLKEIGIEESNVNLQLLADSNREQRRQSEYISWDERESLLARASEHKETASEIPAYGTERKSSKHLDIRA